MKTRLFIVLTVILLLLAFNAPAYAQDIPTLPHAFYGTLTINGTLAPADTTIEARGTNVLTGVQGNPIVTTEVGHYSTPDPLGARLVVQGNIADGTALSFYVKRTSDINWVACAQTSAWHAGAVSELNLTATIGGGGGSGGGSSTPLITITRYASDGTTMLAQTTVDLAQMKTISVQGNGTTHYYHQGPSFDPNNLWDQTETINLKDQGAVKGTDLKDLCNLVGGMSNGDTVVVKATDNFSKTFDYGNVYNPQPRQGKMVICWYNQESGECPNWTEAPELVFLAQTTNSAGQYVFGNWDMHETMPEIRWHYFNSNGVDYPSSNGYTVKYINRIYIFSQQAASTPTPSPSVEEGTPTSTLTQTPAPTATSTLSLTPTPTTPIATPTPLTTSTVTPIPSSTPGETVEPTPLSTPTLTPVHLSMSTTTPVDLSDMIGENGITQKALEITFSDIGAELKIGQGTTALTADGNPLQNMSVQPVAQPPAPLSDYHIIGLAYDFGPTGATFNPPATITLPYDIASLPENISQDDLVIAYYDAQAGNWVQLNCTVDTASHTITAQVSHFTTFAILGKASQTEKSEFNWALVGVIIGAAMIIGVGSYLLVIRRRKANAS